MTQIGKCTKMCPQSEINEHKSEFLSIFECDPNGKFDPTLAIKKYSRSSAGFQANLNNVRPVDVLYKTLQHINSKIVIPNLKSPIETQIKMYHYVRDRLRAVNQDITIQQAHSPEITCIYEYYIAFFIWSGINFRNLPPSDFDFVQNFDQISEGFLSLLEEYKFYPSKNQDLYYSAYVASLFCTDQFQENLSKFKIESHFYIVKSVRTAYLTDNIKLFLNTIKHAPFIILYTVILSDKQIYTNCISSLRLSFKSTSFNPDVLLNEFELSDNYDQIKTAFNINPKGDYLTFDISKQIQIEQTPYFILPSSIEEYHNSHEFHLEFSKISEIDL